MSGNLYLSVVIPAYNEATRIVPSLEQVEVFLKSQTYSSEVIVVNDCSTDATQSVVDKFIQDKPRFRLINNLTNLGKGASVQKGMLIAKGHFRLFADADMSTPIDEVNKLLPYLDSSTSPAPTYDVVIGSRRVPGAEVRVHQPWRREIAGKLFSILVRLLTLRGYLDTQCGFKLFNEASANILFRFLTIPRFGFDVELLYIARKRGFRVLEAPVVWVDSPASTVKLGTDSFQMFMDLFLIRWNNLLGAYK